MPATVAKKRTLHHRKTIEQISVEKLHRKPSATLLKLPVPDIEKTLKQYLLFVKPLTSEQQFDETKRVVEEFGKKGGLGEKIQARLFERHAKKANWASDWWLDDMYLNCRAPLPVNSNPGMVLPRKKFKDDASRLRYAAKLTAGIIDFKIILDARALPVDVARGQLAGQPLCMEQYYRLLNSYRLPGHTKDNLVSFQPPSDDPQHIVVACNNQFYAVDVTLGNYKLTEADFARQFENIVRRSSEVTPANPVGILTSINRSDWAEARDELMQDPINRASLDILERCIFVLCLDKATGAEDDCGMAHQMLHGAGPKWNSANRWYDKTVQLIMGEDGVCGLSYEHSASEGIAVIALIEHLLKYITVRETKGMYRSASMLELPVPQPLSWRATESVSRAISSAMDAAQKTADSLDLKIYRFKDYGKEFIKRQNMSPDAFIQVALQVSYYKIYKRLVSTYESASTRRFREGRVDNIRAATIEALDFAKSICHLEEKTIRTDPHKMHLLLKAIKSQTDFTISAITGHGIDCHLLGLKMMAAEMGLEEPEIFSDPSYVVCNYFQLSTSQIPTNTDSFMCYGAVVPDGYGVSYNPHGDSIVFCVSSFETCPSTSSKMFVAKLEETLLTMKAICQEWNKRRSASSERIKSPSQLSLHRRMRGCSSSSDEKNLRSEPSSHRLSDEQSEKARKAPERTKKFGKQKSLSILRYHRPACPDTANTVREPKPQNAKLSRRYSEVAASTIGSDSPLHSSISVDLMEIIAQERVEFI